MTQTAIVSAYQAVRNYVYEDKPPEYHYKQNIIEGLGKHVFLFPSQLVFGLYDSVSGGGGCLLDLYCS